jgi:hypothetical protein
MTTPPSAIEHWGEPEKPRPPGDIEKAVEADLADLGSVTGPGKRTLMAMARKLARVIDARGEDEPASQTAKAIETLRITMAQIVVKENNDPALIRDLLAGLQQPGTGGSKVPPAIRYPPKPGPADPGR